MPKLPKTMPARFGKGDPRQQGHETTYQPSRGGYFKPTKKPTPGTPKTQS